MDSRFFERKCFVTTSESLLKFMQEQEDDSSLTFDMEKDTKEIFLYSPHMMSSIMKMISLSVLAMN